MTLSIHKQQVNVGDPIYYTDAFRAMIEQHLTFLRQPDVSIAEKVDPSLIRQFDGDFYGLLQFLDIQTQYHWIVLRVNKFDNPLQFGRIVRDVYAPTHEFTLRIPNTEIIEELRSNFLQSRRSVG